MTSNEPRLRGGGSIGPRQHASHDALAALLRNPARPLIEIVKDLVPPSTHSTASDYAQRVGDIRKDVLGFSARLIGARTAPGRELTVVERLATCWEFLFAADQVTKKLAVDQIPGLPGMAWLGKHYGVILGEPLNDILVAAMLSALRVGGAGEYVGVYRGFLKQLQRPKSARGSSFLDSDVTEDDYRRFAWWMTRARREQYVEYASPEPPYITVHQGHLVRAIRKDLDSLLGPVDLEPDTRLQIIDESVTEWLRYSLLDFGAFEAAQVGADPAVLRDIVRAFSDSNRLTQKLIVAEPTSTGSVELQVQLRQYETENRDLENKIRVLEAQLASQASPAVAVPAIDGGGVNDLRELVRLVDAKYSLDLLKAIQHGGDAPLTLRSFVSHLFYALSKKGVVQYPVEPRFDLTYDKSGLYSCDGFEVQPGQAVPVAVSRLGWALSAREGLLPIRKAVVVRQE